jgi:hypothetical protein
MVLEDVDLVLDTKPVTEEGEEPSLRSLIHKYYRSGYLDADKSTDAYIKALKEKLEQSK